MHTGFVDYVGKALDNQAERPDRHRSDLEANYRRIRDVRERFDVVKEGCQETAAKVISMVPKLCTCPPRLETQLSGEGSREQPFGLSYAGSPVSSYATPPVENTSPIPIPFDAITENIAAFGPDSEQENLAPPSCCTAPTVVEP